MPTARLDRRTRRARTEGADAREALLRAAAEVFAEHGFRHASIDEVAARAGYSKGAVYWHFAGKDELFLALVSERIDAPTREMIDLLSSAPPDRDMAPEASRRFTELMREQRDLLLLDQEYWSRAVRDEKLRRRYAKRRAQLRRELGEALAARMRHLGAPPLDLPAEDVATIVMSLGIGLTQQKLIEPDAVPDDLLVEAVALVYRGLVARAEDR